MKLAWWLACALALPLFARAEAEAQTAPGSAPGSASVAAESAGAGAPLGASARGDGGSRAENLADGSAAARPSGREEESAPVALPPGVYPYTVTVSVPGSSDAKELLEKHLSIIAKKDYPNMDAEQTEYLLASIPQEAGQMLKTLGYFNYELSVSLDGSQYRIEARPGEPARIDNVVAVIVGEAESDPQVALIYRDLFRDWRLNIGKTFTQSEWGASKAAALSALTKRKYPLAKIKESGVTVNPARNTASAKVVIDSGAPVVFGAVTVEGARRYPLGLAENLRGFEPGDVYDVSSLVAYQSALEQDGHYSSAAVSADFDAIQDGAVPVRAKVREFKAKKVDVGVKLSSADGLGGRFGIEHINLFGSGWKGNAVVEAARDHKYLGLGLTQPRRKSGRFATATATYSDRVSQNVRNRQFRFSLLSSIKRNRNELSLGVEHYYDHPETSDGMDLGESHIFMPYAAWTRNAIETERRPYNGYYVSVKYGMTPGTLFSSTSAQRLSARGSFFYTPENREWGTWVFRAAAGCVRSNEDSSKIPMDLLFRSGGATSVRGYAQDAIGVEGPDDSILGGKAMATASVEYQYPVSRSISLAVFHDAGAVADDWKDMDWRQGTGVGARWFSPVAPLSFDVAYGHDNRKFAWYVSLGTHF